MLKNLICNPCTISFVEFVSRVKGLGGNWATEDVRFENHDSTSYSAFFYGSSSEEYEAISLRCSNVHGPITYTHWDTKKQKVVCDYYTAKMTLIGTL